MDTLLITGICSPIGKLLAERLNEKYKIIGIDRVNWADGKPKGLKIIQGDLRRRVFQNTLAKNKVDAVIHLDINNTHVMSAEKRHERNLTGCQRVVEGVIKYKPAKFILLSEHSVYGALPNSPLWQTESAPLNGSRLFKENTSLLSVDHMCSELFWKAPEIETVILRPVNILGPKNRGLLNTYLKLKNAPAVFGFDPMMQIIHEWDVTRAIELSLQKGILGKFNVTGPGALPLSVLANEAGVRRVPMPQALAYAAVRYGYKLKRIPFPESALTVFQFNLCVDGKHFRETTGFKPQISLENTVQSIKGFVKLASEVWVGEE